MTTSIHALDVGIIVVPLASVHRSPRSIRARGAANHKTHPGADTGTMAPADCRTGKSADRCTDGSVLNGSRIGGLLP
jgi:hypothetical protein